MSRRAAFGQLVLSRLREFYREPEAVFWVYGFPLLLSVVLGLAFSGGAAPPPPVDVQGSPEDPAVKKIKETLVKHDFDKVEVHPPDEARRRLRAGKTSLIVVPGGKKLVYVYDRTNSDSRLARFWVDDVLARAALGAVSQPADEYVSEVGSRYIDFLLPGLIGANLMGGGLFGVGFVLVDMRVRKLFKRLMATPMNRGDFLLAILTARLVFLIPEMLALFLVGWLLFGVPIHGNLLTLGLVILTGTAAFSGIGLLIASRSEKTETVSGLINLVMLPMYLLSGTFFSSKRFPDEMQPFIQALPLTQVNDALREVMLEGHGLGEIGWRLGILLAWGAVTFVLALKWFRWR